MLYSCTYATYFVHRKSYRLYIAHVACKSENLKFCAAGLFVAEEQDKKESLCTPSIIHILSICHQESIMVAQSLYFCSCYIPWTKQKVIILWPPICVPIQWTAVILQSLTVWDFQMKVYHNIYVACALNWLTLSQIGCLCSLSVCVHCMLAYSQNSPD